MSKLQFSNANIDMARDGDKFILWDKDTDSFGVGYRYIDALVDLANNLPKQYHAKVSGDIDDETLEKARERFDEL